MTDTPPIAIIGAGLAGLACAGALDARGIATVLFDKARGPGGRLASRRLPGAVIDLGAQYFTARHPDFAAVLDGWRARGLVEAWPQRLWRREADGWHRHRDGQPRYCAAPRMSALTRHLAASHEVHAETRIEALAREAGGWWLIDAAGRRHGPFAAVVVSAPAPQASALVAPHDRELAAACDAIVQRPCWAAYAHFDTPLPPCLEDDWQAAFVNTGPLSFVSRHADKPGREIAGEALTLLASPEWSAAWLEAEPGEVAQRLYQAFREALAGPHDLPDPVALGAHRWRYARPVATTDGPGFRLAGSGLALCGDGWRGPRVEDAWLSGHHLGQALAPRLPDLAP